MLGVIALCVAFGLLALLLSLSRWLAHRPWAAAGNLAVAVLLLLVAHRLWPPVLHLQTYESMRPKALIAQVHCERTGPERVSSHAHPASRGPHAGVRDVGRRMAPRRAHAGLDRPCRAAGVAGQLQAGPAERPLPAHGTGRRCHADARCGPRGRIRSDPPRPRQFCPERRGRSRAKTSGRRPGRIQGGKRTSTPATPTDPGGRWRAVPGTTFP